MDGVLRLMLPDSEDIETVARCQGKLMMRMMMLTTMMMIMIIVMTKGVEDDNYANYFCFISTFS